MRTCQSHAGQTKTKNYFSQQQRIPVFSLVLTAPQDFESTHGKSHFENDSTWFPGKVWIWY